MTARLSRFALFVTPTLAALAFAVALGPACTGGPAGCENDGDCTDNQRCVTDTGSCVECTSADDCEAGQGCCNGSCITGDQFEESCGCSPNEGGSQGTRCPSGSPICTAGSERVTGANLADGRCDSPCTPQFGGTLSAVDNTSERGFACTCDSADDLGTCNVPFLRDDGWPHRGSDLCAPDEGSNTCTCFRSNIRCPASAPDCTDTSEGCVDLHNDTSSCGIALNNCGDPGNSLDDGTGTCINGGCTCDQAADCQGDAVNVDSCQFVGQGEVTQCVCDDYTEGGEKAACPMQLACGAGGCLLEGTAYATLDELLGALELAPMSTEADAGM